MHHDSLSQRIGVEVEKDFSCKTLLVQFEQLPSNADWFLARCPCLMKQPMNPQKKDEKLRCLMLVCL